MDTQRASKFKNVHAKKFMKYINFVKLHFWQQIDFWSFLKLQKMDVGQKIFFCEIDLFDSTSFFFWPGLFTFSGSPWMKSRFLFQIQTNIATSLGLTLKPYFSLKHCINRFNGEADPKST